MRLPFLCLFAILSLLITGCPDGTPNTPESSSGVQKVTVQVMPGSDGMTVEQRNISKRLLLENKPGSIKHLYIISTMSGDVLIYSTVLGKVTSSGKRISPTTVVVGGAPNNSGYRVRGFDVNIGGTTYETAEVLQDDGTYGSSIEYLYWFDSNGKYHQHYVTGGQMIHISDQPLNVGKIILNLSNEK